MSRLAADYVAKTWFESENLRHTDKNYSIAELHQETSIFTKGDHRRVGKYQNRVQKASGMDAAGFYPSLRTQGQRPGPEQ
jgi:hypothetical protein